MSSFTSPLVVEYLGEGKWRLVHPFEYHVGDEASDEIISVPVGFVTDFASIPRVFWSILSPYGRHGKAAVVHDYLYATNKDYDRKQSDDIFKEAMVVLGVNWLKRGIMYNAVRWFAGGVWKKYRKKDS